MQFSLEWRQEHEIEHYEMSQEETREIVRDVMMELRKNKTSYEDK